MHIITECSRCEKDFMYHSSETELERVITEVDEVGNNEIKSIVICRECFEVEKFESKSPKQFYLEKFERRKDGSQPFKLLTEEEFNNQT